MAQNTPNLNLTLPGGGSTGTITPPDVADIDVLNANFTKLDTFAGQVGPIAKRNTQYTDIASNRDGLTGMKLGDTYQETDGDKILWKYDGTAWLIWDQPRKTFTPTWTNFTPGASVITAAYAVRGGILYGTFDVALASGFAISGTPTFDAPVAAILPINLRTLGIATITKAGTGFWRGRLLQNAAGKVELWRESGDNMGAASSTSPFTWAVNDSFNAVFQYQVS